MKALKELLIGSPRWHLAVAESLTAGRVQAAVAAVSGASEYFLGGVTAYSLDQKVKHLGVNRASAAAVNCVSADVAEQMAHGACEMFGAEIGLATTGYAEPSPANEITIPFAWWAVAARANVHGGRGFKFWHGRIECLGAKRVEAQQMVAEAALAELVTLLRELRA